MALAILFVPTLAHAVEPLPALDTMIVDQAHVLGDDTGDIEEAQNQFYEATGGHFYVVFIDSFDGMSPAAWAQQTGYNGHLEGKDILLVVSRADLLFQVQFIPENMNFSATQNTALESVAENSLTAALCSDPAATVAASDCAEVSGQTDWHAAIINIMHAFQNEMVNMPAGGATTAPGNVPATGTEGGTVAAPAGESGGLPHWATVSLWILIPLAILGAIIYGYGGYRRKRLEEQRLTNPLGLK